MLRCLITTHSYYTPLCWIMMNIPWDMLSLEQGGHSWHFNLFLSNPFHCETSIQWRCEPQCIHGVSGYDCTVVGPNILRQSGLVGTRNSNIASTKVVQSHIQRMNSSAIQILRHFSLRISWRDHYFSNRELLSLWTVRDVGTRDQVSEGEY